MAKAKRKQHHSTHHSAIGHHSTQVDEQVGHERRIGKSAFDAIGMFSGPMARIMDHNWSLFHKTVQAMQEESLRFFNRRLEHTSHIIENSRDLQGVTGLMHLQQEWMIDLARDCSEQATRFAQLMRDLAAERFAEASETLENEEEEYEEVVHRAAA
jgi:hypothetical protein